VNWKIIVNEDTTLEWTNNLGDKIEIPTPVFDRLLNYRSKHHINCHQMSEKITLYSEMNDKIFDIDMNVLDNARTAIEPISFRGQCNSTMVNWGDHYSSIRQWKLHTDMNYHIEMRLIDHLLNQRYVTRAMIHFLWSVFPQFNRQNTHEITRRQAHIRTIYDIHVHWPQEM
jgi:hypothetical protein